ncbi:hypothetical protein [Oligoflexus tunisiensis]|uniref:hypothetical protein n=1 Tax=Oligoflexus tunisiensis TaxID=708132 RepID=UPI00114CA72F|nr:hypothetical protein [Oligoflexus tunisiensis]
MSRWKDRLNYAKEAVFAAFLSLIAGVSIMNTHALDGEKLGRKGGLIKLLWGWPLGLLCAALALYSLAKIYQQATGTSLGIRSKSEP